MLVPRSFGSGGVVPQGNDPFSTFGREVSRMFDEVFRGFPAMGGRGAAVMGGFAPNLDVRETDNSLEVTAELPGLSEEDVELRLEGDLVTLSGEKKQESKREEAGLHLTERSFGRFQRSFRLPFRPDPAEVKAEFDKGVLHITLPKPQMEQSGGRIPIQAGSGGQKSLGEAKGGNGSSGQGQPAVSAAPQAGSVEKKGG